MEWKWKDRGGGRNNLYIIVNVSQLISRYMGVFLSPTS
jgi:hypothetical protein